MKKLLPEVCTIQYGFPFDSAKFSDSDGMPLIRIRDVVRGYSETYTTEEYKSEYIVHENDLLIGMDGEFNIAKWGKTPALLNQRVCRLAPKDSIDKDYLFYFMPIALKRIEEKTPFVTVKHLSAKELNKIEIPVLPLEEQRKIAETLSKVDELIAFRDQQLAKLDKLVKARFVEMFGDPVYNEMHWETKRLIDICRTIVDCPHSTPHYTTKDTGYKCIRTSAVKKNKILWEKVECISKQEYEERIKRKRPEKGDVIYTREGAILGIAAVIDRDYNVALGQRSMLLSPDIYKCTPCFLSMAMNFDSFLGKALGGVSGSASPHINVGDIKALEIIAPPIEIQNQFSTFVEQVDQQKQTVQQSLEKLELMKKALMQEYFG